MLRARQAELLFAVGHQLLRRWPRSHRLEIEHRVLEKEVRRLTSVRDRFRKPSMMNLCRKLLIANVLQPIGIVFDMAELHIGFQNGKPF